MKFLKAVSHFKKEILDFFFFFVQTLGREVIIMIYNQSRVLFDLPDLESAGSSPARALSKTFWS